MVIRIFKAIILHKGIKWEFSDSLVSYRYLREFYKQK